VWSSAEVRKRLGLAAGTELEMVVEGFAIHLVRSVAGPSSSGAASVLVRLGSGGERAEVDVAAVDGRGAGRWPG